MSRYGLRIAKLFGQTLQSFSTLAEAEKDLTVFRDDRLRKLENLSERSPSFSADYSRQSLKTIEKWYFDLYESTAFEKIGTSREEFEECLAIYFGAVFVRNVPDAAWIIEEFAFEKGKFEIGVRKGLMTIMCSRFTNHFETRDNKRKESIWRMFNKYAN